MIDGTGSFVDAAMHLMANKAKRVYIIATHGILSGDALLHVQHCDAVHGVCVYSLCYGS